MARMLILTAFVALVVSSQAFKLDFFKRKGGPAGMGSGPNSLMGSEMDSNCPLAQCIKAEADTFEGRTLMTARSGFLGGLDAAEYYKRQSGDADADYATCQTHAANVIECVNTTFFSGSASACDCPPLAIAHVAHSRNIPPKVLAAAHCDEVYGFQCQDSEVQACVDNGKELFKKLKSGQDASAEIANMDECHTLITDATLDKTRGCQWTRFILGPKHRHISEFVNAANDGCDLEGIMETCKPSDDVETNPCDVDVGAEFDAAVTCVEGFNGDGTCDALLANQAEDRQELIDFIDNHVCPTYSTLEEKLKDCDRKIEDVHEAVSKLVHKMQKNPFKGPGAGDRSKPDHAPKPPGAREQLKRLLANHWKTA